MTYYIRFVAIMGLVGTLGFGSTATWSLPAAKGNTAPLEQFAAHKTDSVKRISHRNWQRVLGVMFVKDSEGKAKLDYGRVSGQARSVLRRYIKSLQETEISEYTREEQLAYWLNFYNAASVNFVFLELDALARKGSSASRNPHRNPTLRLESALNSSKGYWYTKRFVVEGTRLSLADIEHRIIAAHWRDPLMLYGLSCPAKGCPMLMPQAYQAETIGSQLTAAAQTFVNRGDTLGVRGSKLKVSSVYAWHSDMFESDDQMLSHIRQYGDDFLGTRLRKVTQVKGETFSWKLNGALPQEALKAPTGMFQRGAGASNY
jgi:hypothetical protein